MGLRSRWKRGGQHMFMCKNYAQSVRQKRQLLYPRTAPRSGRPRPKRGCSSTDARFGEDGRSNHVSPARTLAQVAQQLEGRLWRVGKAGPTKARRSDGETYWARRRAGENPYSGFRRAPVKGKRKTQSKMKCSTSIKTMRIIICLKRVGGWVIKAC